MDLTTSAHRMTQNLYRNHSNTTLDKITVKHPEFHQTVYKISLADTRLAFIVSNFQMNNESENFRANLINRRARAKKNWVTRARKVARRRVAFSQIRLAVCDSK